MNDIAVDRAAASKAMTAKVDRISFNQHRNTVTVVIHETHDPDKTGTVNFFADVFPDLSAILVASGTRSNIVYFRGVDGWNSIDTRVLSGA